MSEGLDGLGKWKRRVGLDPGGTGRAGSQVHVVAATKGDMDMGAIDLCPIGAAADELCERYKENPRPEALALRCVEVQHRRGPAHDRARFCPRHRLTLCV